MTPRAPIHKLVKSHLTSPIGVNFTPTWILACGAELEMMTRAKTVWRDVTCPRCLAMKSGVLEEQRLRAKGLT